MLTIYYYYDHGTLMDDSLPKLYVGSLAGCTRAAECNDSERDAIALIITYPLNAAFIDKA